MFENITELIGIENGPTSIILAGVHGNETCGVEALRKILSSLQIEKGRVLFGYGNPHAIETNQRFTETNLNRMFKSEEMLSNKEKTSYEYGRAQFLKKYLNQADALLDIHASTTPGSKPFIICEANADEISKYLPVDIIVSGFDKVEPGGTDYYMNSIGKIGICIECGYLDDPQSVQVAEDAAIAFLKARGHISNDLTPKKQSYICMYDIYLTKTEKFTLSKPFDDFETIERDQIIGTDGDEEVRSLDDSVILFAQNSERIGDEAYLLGKKKNSLT
ncbi:MAG: succinylglutamate desuccinylase/aspartoacylase family protein [Candidatus Taylorbacteria bacterium]